jgi:hypothetical protein
MKADNGYGQNGASNASSDLPGQHTQSALAATMPQVDLEGLKVAENQKRDINGSDGGKRFAPVANAYGMKQR